ncbi:mitochondrial import receptor subunit TOM22 homolog [Agrilus planipennis]|uniref:Mitochondrial import receptor subunit TOM22 homolog n=1 Tax=Agrilus planipennis TaxID=224129 RepID=A0A7F5RKJ3_AGRPL|nr:mitochondrial import receptor subunit TOM22 homolog [Agrilus planipennis]
MSSEEVDSGMGSQEGSAKEFSPDKPAIEENYDDEPDETLSERLLGLSEMFPEPFRNTTHTALVSTKSTVKSLFNFSRNVIWIVVTSSLILFAPVIIEVERLQMEEAQRSQHKQMLLGPNTAISGGGMQPIMPPLQR